MTIKIALTGGPNGGKTTALSVLKENFGPKIEVVKEAATLIFSGGFPRKDGSRAHVETAQRIIYHATKHLEGLAEDTTKARIIICDRGTLDGAVYWPGGIDDFFTAMQTSCEEESKRYAAVIHLSPPLNPEFYQSTQVRTEDLEGAARLDEKILKIWEKHPNRLIVPCTDQFFEKATIITEFIHKLIHNLEKQL